MKKLSKILAAHMECDLDKADRVLTRMRDGFRRRASRSSKKMHSAPVPSEGVVQSAFDSSDERRAFEMILSVIEEFLEDVDMDEIQLQTQQKSWN